MNFAVLYFVGCWLAYQAVKADEHGETEYTRWETFKLTLGSWLTVAISMVGRVQ